MTDQTQLYVKLLDEVVDVWRPVSSQRLPAGTYEITQQQYDRDTEAWEFEPGDIVTAEVKESSDGPILAAVRLANLR